MYQIQKDADLEKIRISEGVVANKHDMRYTLGYVVEPGVIVPLYIRTPGSCLSSGVSRYNKASSWKMGFNVGEDEAWIRQYDGIWRNVEELSRQTSGQHSCKLNNGKYVNPKLITWDNEIRTRFRGNYPGFIEEIGACYATRVLKVGSVYRQGSNYHLQVFLKECKYTKRDTSFESQLSDDDEGYDTVH